MNSVTASRAFKISSALLAAIVLMLVAGASIVSATPGAIDAQGHRALPAKKIGWSALVVKARTTMPKKAIFGIHPDKSKGGLDFLDNLTADTQPEEDWGATSDAYRCDDDIRNIGLTYHTSAYSKWLARPVGAAPVSHNVIIYNSTPRPCNFFFDRYGYEPEYAANIFTPAGSTKITVTLAQKKNGKIRPKKQSALATLYKDTATGPYAGLIDCVLVTVIKGTTVAINVNGGGVKTWEAECAEAKKFGNALSQMTYVKK